MQITIEKTLTGYLVLSTIRNGQYIKQRYEGYTRKEAKELFKQYIKDTYV